ncbi:sarcosine oxidase subunit alpha family protein [Thalassobaculum sp.]|uniref:sarcosine oxidase subunit alpha family protein n=1 Tax=Thalassobaculum sp. TaxID=2022740 RepID=UPI003B5C3048
MIFGRLKDVNACRLPTGGEIDRRRPLSFTFDGRSYIGYAGDTLASALLANDVRLVGRSFKYHRPRGIFTAGPEEPNALVELRRGGRQEPNTRANMAELFHGLEATSQNRWPSLALDAMELNDLVGRFLVAGFYYKTFMGFPGWHFYEKRIRAAAGMGRATTEPDPDSYERMTAHCDVLVVGGGPSGLAAALTAGRSGARVILVEETDGLGGRLRAERETIGGVPAMRWVAQARAELESLAEVRILTRTTAFGYYDDNMIGAVERVADHLPVPPPHVPRQRLWHIRSGRVVLATGAIERHIAFPHNDRPGVMLAGAVRTYLHRFAVRPGRRAVVVANNDDGYRTALDLRAAGVEVMRVVDTRPAGSSPWRDRCNAAGIETIDNAAVTKVHGRLAVIGCDVARRDDPAHPVFEPCDLLAVSGGWSPAVHLHTHALGKIDWDAGLAAFVPGAARQAHVSVGAARGAYSLAACLTDGFRAGAEAAEAAGFAPGALPDTPTTHEPGQRPVEAFWAVGSGKKRFVDLQDDVTADDITLAHREGFVSVEHLKRYTTLGMGTDQGKTSNIIGHALMAEARGEPIPEVGTTRFRPPYTPVSFGAFAGGDRGRHHRPERRSAMHDWHAANGATFVEAGHWLRPQYYLAPGETGGKAAMDRAITEEVAAVRTAVGLVDVSTLGKIDIQGPDAGELLNRLYANGFKTLAVGKARYGLMLREDGIVYDDGTTSRLGENHYLMTTTTAHAGDVMALIEWYLQVAWPELDAQACSVTEQWAAMALAGPKARDVLAAAVEAGTDVSDAALPFMGVTEAVIAGVPVRIFRISFSGELSYEINAPADWGTRVWEALIAAGRPHGIRPYGTEAMAILRIEKGHVTHAELDGRVTLDDAGMGRMASTKKWFVGSGMLDKPAYTDPARPKLVGLVPVDGKTRIPAGSILVANPKAPVPAGRLGPEKLGHVSSSAYLSPTVGHPIALGFVSGGLARKGETVWAVFPLRNLEIEVRITDPVFVDPEGGRLRG